MMDTLVTRSSSDHAVLERGLGASEGFGLPRELLDKARSRLRVVLALALFGGGLSFTVRLFRALESPGSLQREEIGVLYAGLVLLSSALFLGLSYLRRESPGFALRLGLVFEVLLGYTIAIGNTAYVAKNHGHIPFLTWTAPLMILFPLIVPSPPRTTLIVAVLTGSSAWVSVAVVSELGLLHGTLDRYLDASVSPIVATAIAYYGARVIYGLNVDYARATRMGSYVLKSWLGGGGMGEVWRAEHQLLARPAAVKLIRRESLHELGIGEETLRHRFEREAQATALLRSPHTVELYDFGVADDGSFFYVMELLEGLDLEQLVQKYGAMPPERVVHVMLQVCASLAEAHENGLIHRDIKPANIYLCQYGLTADFVKVLDFGLVKAPRGASSTLTDLTVTAENTLQGTPSFMAPEQISGKHEVGPAADVYALGCVAYWMLTGKLVFQAPTAIAMVMSHLDKQPARASEQAPGPIPEALDQLLLDCLAKDPAARPSSMQTLAARLSGLSFELPWTQERASEWWLSNAPEVAARRISSWARKPSAA